MAALATTASSRPHVSMACSVRLAAPATSATDAVLATASPPSARISSDDGFGQTGVLAAAERMTAEVVHHHPRSTPGELECVAPAHAATRTGHDHDVTVEAQRAHLSSPLRPPDGGTQCHRRVPSER